MCLGHGPQTEVVRWLHAVPKRSIVLSIFLQQPLSEPPFQLVVHCFVRTCTLLGQCPNGRTGLLYTKPDAEMHLAYYTPNRRCVQLRNMHTHTRNNMVKSDFDYLKYP